MLPVSDHVMNEIFGNPDIDGDWILDKAWFAENIVTIRLPFDLRMSWGDQRAISKLQCHKAIAPYFLLAMEAVASQITPEDLRAHGWDWYGGCFNFRAVAGFPEYRARHCWGAAFDICPSLGRLGHPEDEDVYPDVWKQAMEAAGFYSGGRFARADWMHHEPSTIITDAIRNKSKAK
jgi:hypothetical protein